MIFPYLVNVSLSNIHNQAELRIELRNWKLSSGNEMKTYSCQIGYYLQFCPKTPGGHEKTHLADSTPAIVDDYRNPNSSYTILSHHSH